MDLVSWRNLAEKVNAMKVDLTSNTQVAVPRTGWRKLERLSLFWIVGVILLTPGCASIFSSTHGNISIRSEPSPAGIIIRDNDGNEVFTGTTPVEVSLPKKVGFFRGADYIVMVSKPGCEPRSITVNRSISGWYWGNILLGGLIGMLIVDPATGAMWTLEKDLPTVKLPCGSGKSNQMDWRDAYLPIISTGQPSVSAIPVLVWLEADNEETHYWNH